MDVAPGLHILGAGGSIPGFRNGKKYWNSFPYESDEEFAKDLTMILDPFFFPEGSSSSPLGEKDAVILMTHNGPDQSSECFQLKTNLAIVDNFLELPIFISIMLI